MEPSAIAAWIALALSLVSLVWQFARAWWDKPVVLVKGELRSSGEDVDGALGWNGTITVTNVGERAVTLTDVGWWSGVGTHEELIERPATPWRLPHRLEPHDQTRFSGALSSARAFGWGNPAYTVRSPFSGEDARAARPFVEIVHRPSRWRVRRSDGKIRTHGDDVIVPNPAEGM